MLPLPLSPSSSPLSLFLYISPTLYFPCTPPYPTVSPLFLFFPSSNIAQMALPYVGILDIPISRSMSNNFLYNFLRLWYSVVTAENWVAEKKNVCRRYGVSISEKGLLTGSPARWPELLSQFLNFKCNKKELMIATWMGYKCKKESRNLKLRVKEQLKLALRG